MLNFTSNRTVFGCVAAMAVAAAGTSVSAALVASDSFLSGGTLASGQYPVNTDIRGKNAIVSGFSATGYAGTTANFQGNATALTSTAVTYEAGGSMKWLGVNAAAFDRNITRQLDPTPASSQWWFSIITSRTATGWTNANQTFAVGGITDAGGSGLQVGFDNTAQDASPDLVIRLNGVNTVLAANIAANAAQYVLVGLAVNTSGNDELRIWINPASLTDTTPPDLIINSLNITDSLTPFTQSKFQSPGVSGEAHFDELRLGTTALDVAGVNLAIPEPASVALLLGGSILLVARQRTRDNA